MMQEQLLAMSLSDNPNNTDNELAVKACKSLKEVFQKCSKKNTNENSFSTVLQYLDNFIGDEKARGLLMDRFFDIIIALGKIQFNPTHQNLNYKDTAELFE